MSNEKKQYTPEELHQRQTWVEIWLPLLIGLAVIAAVVALLILAAVHGSSSIAQWSAISLILMIFPVLFACLVFIAIILFIDYWLIRGNRALPAYAQNIRQKVDIVAGKIQSILTSIIAFFLKVDNIIEMLKSFLAHSSGSDK
jgi:hypothetical protein